MTTRWKLKKMYTRLRASEASEPIFLYLRWKHTILLKSQYIQTYTLLINHYLSVQYVHDCVRNTHDMVLFIRNKKLEKNDIERAERASQNICTFASEKCFTYRPETREKAINDCDLRASHFLCVSETCDSSQYCVGESHSLSVQCVLLFVTLVIYGLIHDDLYRPDTFQKLEKNPLMIMSEQSERAEIFALLRDCVRNVYVFF